MYGFLNPARIRDTLGREVGFPNGGTGNGLEHHDPTEMCGHSTGSTKVITGLSLVAAYLILSNGLLKPPRRFMYCLHVRTFLIFAAPSWFPSTCFPLVEPKPVIPIAAIMDSSSWLTASMDSPSSWSLSRPSLRTRGSGTRCTDSSFSPRDLNSGVWGGSLSRGLSL